MNNKQKQSSDVSYLYLDDYRYYRSQDLGLSCALCTLGYQLIALDRTDRKRVQFIFKRGPDMEREVEAYWSKEMQVSAITYFDTLKMLKNRLYSS